MQQNRWLASPSRDAVFTWGALPLFAIVAHLSRNDTSRPLVMTALGWAFLVSVLHQPLTLLISYGDTVQCRVKRGLLILTPLVGIPLLTWAIVSGTWLFVPIAVGWQLFHTQQQRYGLTRMYARHESTSSPHWDRAVVYAPFISALVTLAASDTLRDQFYRYGGRFGYTRRQAIMSVMAEGETLARCVWPVAIVACAIVLGWFVHERPSKQRALYAASGIMLSAMLVVNPAAGLVAYLCSHAIEYFVVVHKRIAARGSELRSALVMALFLGGFAVLSAIAQATLPGRAYYVATSAVGLLHFTIDAFVWRRS